MDPFYLHILGYAIFAIGRFLSALIQLVVKPRYILLFLYTGMIVFVSLTVSLSGYGGITAAILVYLFEGGAFGLIFAISLRGLGRHVKSAGALMTFGISGGTFLPFIPTAVAASYDIQYCFVVQIAVFAFSALFPLYLNFYPPAREQVDPIPNEYLSNSSRQASSEQPVSFSHGVCVDVKGDNSPLPSEVTSEPYFRSQSIGSQGPSDLRPGQMGLMHDLAPWPQ